MPLVQEELEGHGADNALPGFDLCLPIGGDTTCSVFVVWTIRELDVIFVVLVFFISIAKMQAQ